VQKYNFCTPPETFRSTDTVWLPNKKKDILQEKVGRMIILRMEDNHSEAAHFPGYLFSISLPLWKRGGRGIFIRGFTPLSIDIIGNNIRYFLTPQGCQIIARHFNAGIQ
jgi:hypothetical protein